MPDNLDEIIKKKLIGGIPASEDKDAGPLSDVEKILGAQVRIKAMQDILNPQQRDAPAPVYMQPPPQEQPFKLTGQFDISDIIKSETIARTAAETQKDVANKAYFESVAARYHEMIELLREDKNKSEQHDPLTTYKMVKGMLDEVKNEMAPGMSVGAGDHGTMIELKRMDFDHSRSLEELRQAQRDSDRKWEMDMKKWEMEFGLKKAEFEAGNRFKDNAMTGLGDILGALSESVTKERVGATAPSGSVVGDGLPQDYEVHIAEFPCEKCGNRIPVDVGAESVTCSGCGIKYKMVAKAKV